MSRSRSMSTRSRSLVGRAQANRSPSPGQPHDSSATDYSALMPTPPRAAPAGDPTSPAGPRTRELPGWLEPPGERERWRRELWASGHSARRALPQRFLQARRRLVDRPAARRGPWSAERVALPARRWREPRPSRRAALPRPPRTPRAPTHPNQRPHRRHVSRTAHRRQTGSHSRSRPLGERTPVALGRVRVCRGTGRSDWFAALG